MRILLNQSVVIVTRAVRAIFLTECFQLRVRDWVFLAGCEFKHWTPDEWWWGTCQQSGGFSVSNQVRCCSLFLRQIINSLNGANALVASGERSCRGGHPPAFESQLWIGRVWHRGFFPYLFRVSPTHSRGATMGLRRVRRL